ncbi:MAG: VWA domain-containing protein [Thermoanaerobaculia bacterium]|nr:VWA domain-containing protein [Thermoanaerobaculia bacterium]
MQGRQFTSRSSHGNGGGRRPFGPVRGASSGQVLGALVAIAFIALCVIVILNQKKSHPAADSAPQGPAAAPANQANALELLYYSSSAKKTWTEEMVKAFHDSGAVVGGRPIRIKTFHVNSGESLDQMKEGKIQPDLWSPGDESWLRLAAEHWKLVKQKQLFANFKHLVDVPLVVAMWEPMARAMGYPKPISWKDIDRLAANPKGWESLGHPEWGKFRWGHAHPDANSGFLSILSLVYAAAGKTDGLTAEDLARPEVKKFVKELEERVEHYGLSNTWLDDLMHLKGPSYLSAAVQYENTIIESNEKYKNKPLKLVAVYPSEGMIWTTHPIVAIEEAWTTPEKTEAAGKFIDFLLSAQAQKRAMELGLRPISKEVALGSPFDDEHGVNPKLASDKRFTVPDEKVLRRVIDLWEEVKVPATIILVLDRSGSMKGTPMDNAKEGSVLFVKSMKARDQLEVVVFNHRVTTLVQMCQVKECGESAVERLQGVFAEGETALYDVVGQTYRRLVELKRKDPGRRYGLIVLTDGRDTSSSTQRNDFMDVLPTGEDWEVPKIYTIAYGAQADKDLLKEISNRTNARLFESKAEDIAKTYKELSANF